MAVSKQGPPHCSCNEHCSEYIAVKRQLHTQPGCSHDRCQLPRVRQAISGNIAAKVNCHVYTTQVLHDYSKDHIGFDETTTFKAASTQVVTIHTIGDCSSHASCVARKVLDSL